MPQKHIVCPKCGRADAIRKVSSFVSAGTSQSESFGYGIADIDGETHFVDTRSYGSSSTGLANRLSAPNRPAKPSPLGCVGTLLFSRVGLTLGVLGLIGAGAACSFPLFAGIYRESPLLILLPILIFVVVTIRLIWWTGRSFLHEARSVREDRLSYPHDIERWERAMERWRELYYCYRDDGVFLPHQTRLVAANDMQILLYAAKKKKREG